MGRPAPRSGTRTRWLGCFRRRRQYNDQPTEKESMARNTQVKADTNAPPITQLLAKYVATHPSRGWDDGVDHEAHRAFLNGAGCAIGAAKHESAEATLAAIRELQPAAQSA